VRGRVGRHSGRADQSGDHDTAEQGDPRASYRVGMMLDDRDPEAEAAVRRAEARGNPDAVSALAGRLSRRTTPDWEGAEAANRRAAAIGYRDNAWSRLGVVLEKRGDPRGAEAAYHRAIERGERDGAGALRRLYQKHPELTL
jgi:Flp pilus assembly protein TadD